MKCKGSMDFIKGESMHHQPLQVFPLSPLQGAGSIGSRSTGSPFGLSGYLASVHFMDEQVGRVLDALDRFSLREEAIVVFVSDHEFNLGEHDCWNKPSFWESTVQVTLIISDPSKKETGGTKVNTITELTDLYPTITETGEFKDRQPEIIQGKSLVKYLDGETEVDETAAYTVLRKGKDATIRTERYRYTRWGEDIEEGNEELYDYVQDPFEYENLVGNKKMKKVLAEMRDKFEEKRKIVRKRIRR